MFSSMYANFFFRSTNISNIITKKKRDKKVNEELSFVSSYVRINIV